MKDAGVVGLETRESLLRERSIEERVVRHWNRVPWEAATAPSLPISRSTWTKLSGVWCDFWDGPVQGQEFGLKVLPGQDIPWFYDLWIWAPSERTRSICYLGISKVLIFHFSGIGGTLQLFTCHLEKSFISLVDKTKGLLLLKASLFCFRKNI